MACISCKEAPEGHTSFAAAQSAKRLSEYVGKLFERDVLRWIDSPIQTVICDAVHHELQRVLDEIKGCDGCTSKVTKIMSEASAERYKC